MELSNIVDWSCIVEPVGFIPHLIAQSDVPVDIRIVSAPVVSYVDWTAKPAKHYSSNPKYLLGLSERWNYFVIDRREGVVKRASFAPSVHNYLSLWGKQNSRNVWSIVSCDFTYTKTGSGIKTRYTIAAKDITELTNKELLMIRKLPELVSLMKFYPLPLSPQSQSLKEFINNWIECEST